jgi:hypothetical protein
MVMQGHQDQFQSKLFRLPHEILAEIVDLLEDDKKALAALALVNSNFLRLARARQFKEIHFDYSPQSHELLSHMADFKSVRDENDTKFWLPISDFVRKFTFAPLVDFFPTIHPELYSAMVSGRNNEYHPFRRPQHIPDELLITAQEHYVNQRKTILKEITRMSFLVELVWKDKIQLDSDFIEAVSRCAATHVTLEGIRIGEHWPAEPPLTPERWNIRSLDLDVNLNSYAFDSGVDAVLGDLPTMALNPPSVFLNTLFQRCSSTLESLNWRHTEIVDFEFTAVVNTSKLTFPSLQRLRLVYMYINHSLWSSLMSPSLRHLELPASFLYRVPQNLKISKGEQYLETLVVNAYGNTICDSSLAKLNTFVSLKRLTLRVGWSNSSRCNWLVQHDTLRRQLSGLKRLETLLLIHDTYYRPERHDISPYQYYDKRIAITSDLRDAKSRPCLDGDADHGFAPREITEDDTDEDDGFKFLEDVAEGAYISQVSEVTVGNPYVEYFNNGNGGLWAVFSLTKRSVWERAHRNRMLTQAEAYAEVFPALETIYCGQWPMGIRPRRDEDGVVRKEAFPLCKDRDESQDFPNKIFKMWNEEREVGA